jgi:hypothetical protein
VTTVNEIEKNLKHAASKENRRQASKLLPTANEDILQDTGVLCVDASD